MLHVNMACIPSSYRGGYHIYSMHQTDSDVRCFHVQHLPSSILKLILNIASNSKFNVSCYRSLAILTGPQTRGWLQSITILESYSSQKKNIMATLLESLKSLRANPNLQLYVSNLYETT